jgi:uncharacterized membrane protein
MRPAEKLIPALDAAATALQRIMRTAFEHAPASEATQDALRGRWLGHPLHPALTDAVMSGLTMCSVFDALDALGDSRFRRAADAAVLFGVVSALPTALAGAADWQHAEGRARRLGLLHIAANSMVLACSTASLVARGRGRRGRGRVWALIGFGLLNAGAYLGGMLIYHEGMGVHGGAAGK